MKFIIIIKMLSRKEYYPNMETEHKIKCAILPKKMKSKEISMVRKNNVNQLYLTKMYNTKLSVVFFAKLKDLMFALMLFFHLMQTIIAIIELVTYL